MDWKKEYLRGTAVEPKDAGRKRAVPLWVKILAPVVVLIVVLAWLFLSKLQIIWLIH